MAARVLAEAPSERFALAALSMGGYVAMEIMRQAPQRVTRLALLDTRARLDTPEETAAPPRADPAGADGARLYADHQPHAAGTDTSRARHGRPALIDVIRAMADRTGVEGYIRQQQAIMSRPDFRPYLRRSAVRRWCCADATMR